MNFKERYTSASRKIKDPDTERDKTELSEDAFAIGDMIESLIQKIEFVRLSLRK